MSRFWFLAVIMLVLDIYVFQAVKYLAANLSDRWRITVFVLYWTFSVVFIATMLLFPVFQSHPAFKAVRNYLFVIAIGLFMAKAIAAVFFLIDDIRRLLFWVTAKIFPTVGARFLGEGQGISRSVFLSWLGIGLGTTLFGSLIYGFRNKYRYDVKRIKLNYANLPAAFKGLKIVHISDIHSGSFNDKKAVNHGIDMILKENADLILFTGDLVNDRAIEMDDYMDVFNRLKAPMGVYSTLGNHDYGDYYPFDTIEEKRQNLEDLKAVHKNLGWRLLINENIILEKNNENIALLGIENWSAKGRFPKYGKMSEAYAGTEEIPFKILMSHDPSHWDAEVRTNYSDIDLMLSGHTHGMQYGLETPYFKFSPVQWMYKQWAGLYEEGNQKLYVNRGFGFIGYPGRVGILPEITVIELA